MEKTAIRTLAYLVLIVAALAAFAQADEKASSPASPDKIVLRECLVIHPVGRYGRRPVHTDAVEAMIVNNPGFAPKAGDTVKLPKGTWRIWEPATADENGLFKHDALKGGYAYITVDAKAPKAMLLAATGHSMVYVNGEPRVGDIYQTKYVWLPVLLKKGKNHFLFHCARGCFAASLIAVKAPAMFNVADATLPDLIVGEKVDAEGAVIVINAAPSALKDLSIRATRPGAAATTSPVPTVPPMSIRKVGFRLAGPAPSAAGKCKVKIELLRGAAGRLMDAETVTLRIRKPGESYKRTFRSNIDGSVQYYAVRPAGPTDKNAKPALFLTLHGAGVEASGQAGSYSPKSWGHVVAPTNRRPFGFDWEDWGRLDAMEVIDIAQKRLKTDPRRTYLTGHSMGGHGVWHVGAIYPDRFAAIGPSAGWISFWTYAGAAKYEKPTPIEQMLVRASTISHPLLMAANYTHYGIYILHGAKDDNVPVGQSRLMNRRLRKFHKDVAYHEQPDVKHWWDITKDRPGTDCVDWPAMFDFFAEHTVPLDKEVSKVNFITVNPGISAWSHWAGIEAQIQHLQPSLISISCDAAKRRFVGGAKNVARLALDLGRLEPGEAVGVELDGQKLEDIPWPKTGSRIRLVRKGKQWSVTPEPPASLKGPHRYGPFKEAFRNRMVFVYGTKGKPEENAWAFAKARYDAETFWYRGNGSIDVVPDTAFDASADRDRNVILYGNADTNAAWGALLADSPVQVRRGLVRVGPASITGGAGLACLFIRPRPGSDTAAVGVVAGSGPAGMRMTNRLPYFVSGVGYPDCIVIAPESLKMGAAGIITAGFFGIDWSIESGQFAWRKK